MGPKKRHGILTFMGPKKRHGYPWMSMDIHQWISMDIHQWISLMDIHQWYSSRPREPGLEICRPLPRPPWKIHGKSKKKGSHFVKKWRFREAILSKTKFKKKKSKYWKLIGYTRRFILVKHENRPPPCHVRPNPAKVRGNRFAWSMPCPRTPPDLPYSI